MVHDDEPVGLDGLRVCFDDERVVSDAGVMLVATLAGRLGIEALAAELVRLRGDRPGAANAGRKVMGSCSRWCWALTASTTQPCCAPGARGDCWAAGCRRRRRWGRSCARLRSGTCASSTRCSAGRSSGRGRPAPVPARAAW